MCLASYKTIKVYHIICGYIIYAPQISPSNYNKDLT